MIPGVNIVLKDKSQKVEYNYELISHVLIIRFCLGRGNEKCVRVEFLNLII